MKLTRREFMRLAGCAGGAAALGSIIGPLGCGSRRMRDLRQKVVILGFDGVSPGLLEPWVEKGLLPNIQRLMRLGGYRRLETTNPPESPVAWASFAIGGNPGRTGIYDFLRRDPKTYFPEIAIARPVRPKFLWGTVPVSAPRAICRRRGKSFWKLADEQGIRSVVLEAPVSFEPERLEGGYILSGLGVPDLRGTQGTYHYFSNAVGEDDVENTEMGGKLVNLRFQDGIARAEIQGPWDPVLSERKGDARKELAEIEERLLEGDQRPKRLDALRQERAELQMKIAKLERERPILSTPVKFRRIGTEALSIEVCGRSLRLAPGQWSKFVEVEFDVTPIVSASGIARFYLESLLPDVRVYMSPINIDPRDPVLPISSPRSFARQLAEKIGLYKTQGWAIDTMAYNEGNLTDEAFLQDVVLTFEFREKMLLHALKDMRFNLFFELFSGTDRVQHLFWRLLDKRHSLFDPILAKRLGEPILDAYRRMDNVIGKVLKILDSDTTLLVLSDHGFHPFRRGLNLNTWLVRNGFMRLASTGSEQFNLENLFGHGDFWPNVDWERTRAYSLGLGQIYINLAGREGRGVVKPGPEYRAVKNEIIQRLSGLRDADTGEVAVRAVYDRDGSYWGPAFDEAPDLQVGMASGYRVSWQSTLGGISSGLFLPNDRRWSGDHCSLDSSICQGVLLSNKAIGSKRPSIMDIAPTALSLLQVGPDFADMDGASLALT
ncbi:alkaline phosphatase family protein [bacterium]|nr:alkaline phosphatase family protein [bacterium]